jgi:uncharacterized protein (TIGR00730 family)
LQKKEDTFRKLNFTRTNGPVDEAIDRLIALSGGILNPHFIREMILTALKAGQEEKEKKADLKLMNSTLKEMRYTSKIFGPYKNVRKVTIFGSARTRPEQPEYRLASLLGRKLSEAGYMIITGGGPGIMQAANEGAGPERSFGVNIRLPFEQKANPVIKGTSHLIQYKYFFNRKVAFIKEAHAVVLFPGGFGTLDEAMEILTLVQTGKTGPIPLILIDEPGDSYWSTCIDFFRNKLLAEGYICASDFSFFEVVYSVDAAVEKINAFYRLFHSLRYVNGQLVIRLTSAPDAASIKYLKETFPDILAPRGDIRLTGPLPEEEEEPELADLPRLVLDFDHKSFGRLRSFIDELNRCSI